MKYWVQPRDRRASTMQALSAEIAAAAVPLMDRNVGEEARGIYLATGDAGVDVSVGFWAMALAETPRFANPAGFPWTLANAPASLLARELRIRGPNYTLVGGADAMLAALEHAEDDLALGNVAEALVVGCDLGVRPSRVQAAAAVLLQGPGLRIPERALGADDAAGCLEQILSAAQPE